MSKKPKLFKTRAKNRKLHISEDLYFFYLKKIGVTAHAVEFSTTPCTLFNQILIFAIVLFENSQKFLKNAQKHKLDPFERHEIF